MYGNVEIFDYIPLTVENILLRVSQEDIFQLITGEYPDLNRRYYSYIRPEEDTNGTCFYSWYNGTLYFVDFGNNPSHLDCFNLVSIKYGLTFSKALRFINYKFKLGLGGEGEPIPVKDNLQQKRELYSGITKLTEINFKPRPFNQEDKAFWYSYGITRKNLIEDSVFPIYWFSTSSNLSRRKVIRPFSVSYAISEFSPRIKIYTPYIKRIKWISTVNKNDVGNLHNLPIHGKLLIIQKSYKDARVLRNFGINSVWFQNEGVVPDPQILVNLCRRFDKIIVWFDNDKAGKVASEKISSILNSYYSHKSEAFYLPEYLLNNSVKDPSDMIQLLGKQELESTLKKNKFL